MEEGRTEIELVDVNRDVFMKKGTWAHLPAPARVARPQRDRYLSISRDTRSMLEEDFSLVKRSRDSCR